MKPIRSRDRKFLLMMGATVLLIAVFFFAGVRVARLVTGGARKVDTQKIEALIDEGELSSHPARFGRAAGADDTAAPAMSGDRQEREDQAEEGDGTDSVP